MPSCGLIRARTFHLSANGPLCSISVIHLEVLFLLFMCVFTALLGMQTRSSDENSVYLSVRLSVRPPDKRVDRDKTEETSVQIFIPHERSFSLVF